MQEIMVFTNLVLNDENFDRDEKAGIITVLRDGIQANFLSQVEAPESPFGKVERPKADLRALPKGSQWKPRPGVAHVTSANGEFEWYVLVPADPEAKF